MKLKTYFIFYILFIFTLISCKKDDMIVREPYNFTLGYFIDDWKYEFYMSEGERNAFRLWIPDGVVPRAVVVLAPGNASDGTGLVEYKAWQEYAEKEKLALLGVHVRSSADEAAANLIYALQTISKERGIDNASELPLLLRGHSHGGGFSYQFSSLHPKRVLGFSNIKGSLTNTSTSLPPGLFIVGEKDLEVRNISIKNAFLSQRKKKSIICYAVEPNGGHGVGDTDELVRAFFTAILKKRLVNNMIQDINEEAIYLGNTETLVSYPYADYTENKEEASCLIDMDFSNAWLDFVK